MLTVTAVTLLVAWWLIKRPPKIVKWILNNKIKSLMVLAAAYLGYGAVQKTIHRVKVQDEVQRIKQEARMRHSMKQKEYTDGRTTQSNTPYTDATQKATKQNASIKNYIQSTQHQSQVSEQEKLKQQEAEAVMQNTFVSSPETDMSARSGPRAAAAHVRMKHFVNLRAQKSVRPDLSGMHTLLIYQLQNPTNHVALHIGFHAGSLNKKKPYQVYESVVKTEKGTMPMIGKFNVRFKELPDITLGVSADENGVKLVDALPNVATLDISKDNGRTALQVASDGTLAFLTEEKDIQSVFSCVNLEQVAPLNSRGFRPYNIRGRYVYPQLKQAKPLQLKTNHER